MTDASRDAASHKDVSHSDFFGEEVRVFRFVTAVSRFRRFESVSTSLVFSPRDGGVARVVDDVTAFGKTEKHDGNLGNEI